MSDEARSTQHASRGRTMGSRRCPSCGSQVSAHSSVCPACGETLQDQSGQIRCRHCSERSPAELTLCPYCGRELASAPPRVLTWGVPAVLVALILILLVRQVGSEANPLAWAQERLSVEGLPAENAGDRGLVVVVTPAAGDGESTDAGPASSEAAAAETASTASASGVVSSSEIVSASELAAAEFAAVAEGVAPLTAENQPVAAQPETESVAQTVQPGDDVSTESQPAAVAAALQAVAKPVEAPPNTPTADTAQGPVVSAASAGGASDGALPTSTPTSTETATPIATVTSTPTATPAVTNTATPVPMPTYEIRRGDTLIVVARKNDVSVEDLMRVNGISAAEAFTIQPGEKLLIPVEGSEPTDSTDADEATQEATAVSAATTTPLPTPTTPSMRLDAPILRSPEPGTPVSCSEPGQLAWLPVPFMRAEDKFVLHLGFVSGRMDNGRDIVIWVLEQPFPSSAVSWDMDGSLCGLAPQEFDRKWHWYVEVVEEVDGALRPVSPQSETWHFNWN